MKTSALKLAASAAALLLAGCMLGPDYSRPALDLPESYSEKSAPGKTLANLDWWSLYRDPVLVDLIRTSLLRNRDLQSAAARIEQARALLGFVRADQFPRVDLSAEASRTNPSNEILAGKTGPDNNFQLLGGLSFEIDIWGKLARATEAQRAELLSTDYAYQAITLSLVAETASAYFTILGLDDRIAIAQGTLKNRADATKVIRDRFNHGVVPELDVNQAEIEQADAAITLISLERQRKQTENGLSLLLGSTPRAIPRGVVLAKQDLTAELPGGVPAALLERRPDVLAAEAQVIAASARIGVAEAGKWPSLDLLGFIGLQSRNIDNFVSNDPFTWSIGGSLIGPLLDFGKSEYNVEANEAAALGALKSYEQSVLKAVREVDDSLVAIRTFRDEYQQRERQVKSAQNAAHLSRSRYNDGVTSYLEVLDIERSLFESELGGSAARENYLNSIVRLYKSLGGGWTPPKSL